MEDFHGQIPLRFPQSHAQTTTPADLGNQEAANTSPTSSPESPTPPARNKFGQWEPGESGNRNGRPPGSRNKASVLREALGSLDEQLFRQLRLLLSNGHPGTVKLLADRLCPAIKERLICLPLPVIKTQADADEAHAIILKAVGEGEITLGEAEKYRQLVEHHRQIIEKASRRAAPPAKPSILQPWKELRKMGDKLDDLLEDADDEDDDWEDDDDEGDDWDDDDDEEIFDEDDVSDDKPREARSRTPAKTSAPEAEAGDRDMTTESHSDSESSSGALEEDAPPEIPLDATPAAKPISESDPVPEMMSAPGNNECGLIPDSYPATASTAGTAATSASATEPSEANSAQPPTEETTASPETPEETPTKTEAPQPPAYAAWYEPLPDDPPAPLWPESLCPGVPRIYPPRRKTDRGRTRRST